MADADLDARISRVARTLLDAQYVLALTGAGISVESGIPPFRGPGGLWTKYGEPPMNGYQQFLADPKAWWERRLRGDDVRPETASFDTAQPNAGHYALADLERMDILKYLITQNVDNLHYEAGSQHVVEIHGNRTRMRCTGCLARWPRADFLVDPEQLPPRCPFCGGVVKGDGVMFGEAIPSDALEICHRESLQADCVLIVGTSGTVYPAAEFPLMAQRRGATLIEVNPYETHLTRACDLVLRGPSGELLSQVVQHIKELLEVRGE
ncbi:MAG: NAD-dependent protein deacylase [Chloroflexi bacterium]|nr:NAD-dependent protein deacylase [Chloroflexota bacterium]